MKIITKWPRLTTEESQTQIRASNHMQTRMDIKRRVPTTAKTTKMIVANVQSTRMRKNNFGVGRANFLPATIVRTRTATSGLDKNVVPRSNQKRCKSAMVARNDFIPQANNALCERMPTCGTAATPRSDGRQQ